jgi:hypothetical protein
MPGGVSLQNLPLLTIEEADRALEVAMKEAEQLTNEMNAAVRRNRDILMGSGA